MTQATKERARRERLREYEAALAAARPPVEVLVSMAMAREARAHGEPLEELFAVAPVEGVDDEHRLTAAVWVALRQGDVDATIDALVRASRQELVIAAHEELDAGYRLTTVEERRCLPNVEQLEAHMAAFLQVPPDVVAIIAGWGPDDPRTAVEIERLLDQRFGPVSGEELVPAAAGDRPPALLGPVEQPIPAPPPVTDPRPALVMSSAEFTAMLNLTPEQRALLDVLVRQADITISAGNRVWPGIRPASRPSVRRSVSEISGPGQLSG